MMIELQKPHINLFSSYMDFINETRACGEKVWDNHIPKPNESNEDYVNRLLRSEHTPEAPLVPETTYWITKDDKVVGRIALRHFLNENLKEFGGNIGYEIRPSSRRQGIAKEALKLILLTPKAQEIGKLLLTCAPNNIGSIKTIVANGGKLERTAYVEKWQRETSYYWISLRRLS